MNTKRVFIQVSGGVVNDVYIPHITDRKNSQNTKARFASLSRGFLVTVEPIESD